MSIIIRLQNLPFDANAVDIRRYFHGLSIPDGGVHIVGGELGDAFIAFSTDEDARLAMQKNLGFINTSQIKLFLSSKTEMQNVIAAAKSGAGAPMSTMQIPGGLRDGRFLERPVQPIDAFGPNRGMVQMNDPFHSGGNQLRPPLRPADDRQMLPRQIADSVPGMPMQSMMQQTPLSRPYPTSVAQPSFSTPLPSAVVQDQTGRTRASRFSDGPMGYRDNMGGSGDPWSSIGQTPQGRPPEQIMNDRRQPEPDRRLPEYKPNEWTFSAPMQNMQDMLRPMESTFDARPVGGFMDMRPNVPQQSQQQSSFVNSDMMRQLGTPNDSRYPDMPDSRRPGAPDNPLLMSNASRPLVASDPQACAPPLLAPPRVGPAYKSAIENSQHPKQSFQHPGIPSLMDIPGRQQNQICQDGPEKKRPRLHEDESDRRGDYSGRVSVGDGGGFRTVKCSNFPSSFNYKEVRRFFQSRRCDIPRDGVKMLNTRDGKRCGDVYVMFETNAFASRAISSDGVTLMSGKIRIEECSQEEFDRVHDGQCVDEVPERRRSRSRSEIATTNNFKYLLDTHYFVTKRLHPNVERSDVKKFYGKFSIAGDGSPFMEIAPNNELTGNALVAIEKLRNPNELIRTLHRSKLNGSVVEVVNIGKDEYLKRIQRSFEKQLKSEDKKNEKGKDTQVKDKVDDKLPVSKPKVTQSNQQENNGQSQDSCWIHMKGIPFTTTESTIQEFFRDLDIMPNGIWIVKNSDGRPAGHAYVEFSSMSHRRKAFERNKQYMAKRLIKICNVSRAEVEKVYSSRQQQQQQEANHSSNDPVPGRRTQPPLINPDLSLRLQNLHSETQLEDILDFFNGYSPIVDSIKLQYKNGLPTGDGLVAFRSRDEAISAMHTKQRQFLLGRQITLSMDSTR